MDHRVALFCLPRGYRGIRGGVSQRKSDTRNACLHGQTVFAGCNVEIFIGRLRVTNTVWKHGRSRSAIRASRFPGSRSSQTISADTYYTWTSGRVKRNVSDRANASERYLLSLYVNKQAFEYVIEWVFPRKYRKVRRKFRVSWSSTSFGAAKYRFNVYVWEKKLQLLGTVAATLVDHWIRTMKTFYSTMGLDTYFYSRLNVSKTSIVVTQFSAPKKRIWTRSSIYIIRWDFTAKTLSTFRTTEWNFISTTHKYRERLSIRRTFSQKARFPAKSEILSETFAPFGSTVSSLSV